MQALSDISGFLKSLSYIDILFFFSVLALMLLIIALIYYVKESKFNIEKNLNISNSAADTFNLEEITKAIESSQKVEDNLNANLDKYEAEQEEKAIISYDELIKRKNNYAINYLEETTINDDLTVKKVDLDNLLNVNEPARETIKAAVISYEKEEAFLKALKELKGMLN